MCVEEKKMPEATVEIADIQSFTDKCKLILFNTVSWQEQTTNSLISCTIIALNNIPDWLLQLEPQKIISENPHVQLFIVS